jgi:hypothetical protein
MSISLCFCDGEGEGEGVGHKEQGCGEGGIGRKGREEGRKGGAAESCREFCFQPVNPVGPTEG